MSCGQSSFIDFRLVQMTNAMRLMEFRAKDSTRISSIREYCRLKLIFDSKRAHFPLDEKDSKGDEHR